MKLKLQVKRFLRYAPLSYASVEMTIAVCHCEESYDVAIYCHDRLFRY